MKILYEEFRNPIIWKENEVPVILVENKSMFTKLISDINMFSQEKELSSLKIFSDSDKEINNIKCIIDPFNLSTNEKEILKILNSLLVKRIKQNKIEIDKNLNYIYKIYEDAFFDLPIDVDIDNDFNQSQLTKLFKYEITDDSKNLIEKIQMFLETMNYFNIYDLYIFVNVKLFLNEKEYKNFKEYILYEKIPILIIEQSVEEKNQNEKYFIIDSDLCEIF